MTKAQLAFPDSHRHTEEYNKATKSSFITTSQYGSECIIPLDDNGGVFDDFFDANTQDLDILDHRRDPGAHKPANQDVIPTVRRSLRNWGKVNRYARIAQACVMALCNLAMFLSIHPFIPEFPQENTTDSTAYHTIVATSGERVGSNPDSGEPTDMPSYALTGLSRFQKQQLDYVQQLDSFAEDHSPDPDNQQWKPTNVYKHRITNHHG